MWDKGGQWGKQCFVSHAAVLYWVKVLMNMIGIHCDGFWARCAVVGSVSCLN